MKPTDNETTAEVNIPAFIKDLRDHLAREGSLEDWEIPEDECPENVVAERNHGHSNDCVDAGVSLGQDMMADDLRAIFVKHGVAL